MLENQRYLTQNSTHIKEGLLNIKKNQMELLKQLKSQHQVLKKFNPTPVSLLQKSNFQQSLEYSKQLSNADDPFIRLDRKSQLITSMNLQEIIKINQNLQQQNKYLKRQNQLVQQDYQQIKQSYYNEKNRLKQTNIHIQFEQSMFLSILNDIVNGESSQIITKKVLKQLSKFKLEYNSYNDYALQQTIRLLKNVQFQGINKKNLNQNPEQQRCQKNNKDLGNQNKFSKKQNFNQQTFNYFFNAVNQTNDKGKKLINSQLLRQKQTQIQIKKGQIQQLKHRIRTLEDELMTISAQRKMKLLDLQRYKNQVRNLDDSITEQMNSKRQLQVKIRFLQEKMKNIEEKLQQKQKIIQNYEIDNKRGTINYKASPVQTNRHQQVKSVSPPQSLKHISNGHLYSPRMNLHYQGNYKNYHNSNCTVVNNPIHIRPMSPNNRIETVLNVPVIKSINSSIIQEFNNIDINTNNSNYNTQQLIKLHQLNKFLSQENANIKRSINELNNKNNQLINQNRKLQQLFQNQTQRLTVLCNTSSQRYQKQILSMSQHIQTLKIQYNKLVKQLEQNRFADKEVSAKKGAIKLNTVIQHLWGIKQVEFQNLNQFLKDLKKYKI